LKKIYLGNEDVDASMLVIPTKLIDGISSMQYYLVFHYVLSVSAPAWSLVQPHCSPEQLVLQYYIWNSQWTSILVLYLFSMLILCGTAVAYLVTIHITVERAHCRVQATTVRTPVAVSKVEDLQRNRFTRRHMTQRSISQFSWYIFQNTQTSKMTTCCHKPSPTRNWIISKQVQDQCLKWQLFNVTKPPECLILR